MGPQDESLGILHLVFSHLFITYMIHAYDIVTLLVRYLQYVHAGFFYDHQALAVSGLFKYFI